MLIASTLMTQIRIVLRGRLALSGAHVALSISLAEWAVDRDAVQHKYPAITVNPAVSGKIKTS